MFRVMSCSHLTAVRTPFYSSDSTHPSDRIELHTRDSSHAHTHTQLYSCYFIISLTYFGNIYIDSLHSGRPVLTLFINSLIPLLIMVSPSSNSSFTPLPTQSLLIAYSVTLAGALIMVGGVSLLRVYGWTTPLQGRKLMHLLTGPVFILTWLLYPMDQAYARYIAASVPLSVAIYIYLNSIGRIRNFGLIQTVSRSGSPRELADGPFYYGLIHSLAAAYYWLDSPTGVIGLIILCCGDGVADLIGRPYGRTKWRHNRDKSVEGSMAFILATTIVLYAYVHTFRQFGFFQYMTAVS